MIRDIRQDLRERLRALETQRDKLHVDLKEAEQQIGVLMNMLEIEDRRFPPQASSDQQKPTKRLSDFIFEELGRRRMTKEEIKIAAEKNGYENVGRGVHVTLVNMEKSGRIHVVADNKYEQQIRSERSGAPFYSGFSGSH
jgi:hypothetical protein